MSAIGKTEIVDRVAASAQVSKATAATVVTSLLETIGDALQAGESVTITGFGSFKVADRAARDGRNPATGESMKIAASKAVRFSVGASLKDKVNTKAKKK